MNIVSIDTSQTLSIKVSLDIEGRVFSKDSNSKTHRSQMTLLLIEELLADHHISIQDIHSIQVNPGPGSFTGVRVGISVANCLGTLLQIPVNGKHSLVKAIY